MENKIEIPIGNGMKIVAEQNNDPYYDRELYVGIVDADGSWIQDLVCVRNDYRYNEDGELEWKDNSFHVVVWGDERRDDLTDEFDIKLREDLEPVDRFAWLKPYLNTVLEDDGTDYGGTSFAGETVCDFLIESCIDDCELNCLDDLNEVLIANGIKPVGVSDDYPKEFIEFVRNTITVGDEETEPFCPFSTGGYCDIAYSNSCYMCDLSRKAYEERYKE